MGFFKVNKKSVTIAGINIGSKGSATARSFDAARYTMSHSRADASARRHESGLCTLDAVAHAVGRRK